MQDGNKQDNATRPHRVRHYVFATHDMKVVCDQIYEFLELSPAPKTEGTGGTEKYGFYSTMMCIGTTMVEVVQPIKPDHYLSAWLKKRGGDGGFQVVLQTFDAEALKRRAAAENLKLTIDMMFQGQHMIQFDYKHFGTHFELYEYSPEENWWGDPINRSYPEARVASEIVGGEVAVENPEDIAAQIARLFIGKAEGKTVRFGDRTITFSPVQGLNRGLIAIDLKAREKIRVDHSAQIGGVQFRLV